MSQAVETLLPSSGTIHVRGARVHNLQNVHVEIPRQRWTVVTGVSGSGKSSLAFDVLHAESQRRFLESLSSEARARVATWQRPDVDVIDGLPPTIAVGQRSATASLRSTLASTTEILDYLRLLFARCGQAHCPQCGRELAARTAQEIVDQILQMEEGRKVMLLAPRVRSQRGQHRDVFESIAKAGFVRARVDGEIVEAATPPALTKSKPHTIDAVVDRIVVKAGLQARLRESIELALRHGDGTVVLSEQDGDRWLDRAYSSRFACAECRISFAELEPRTLSFNSPHGACLTCRGLGVVTADEVDPVEITQRQSEQRELCRDCAGTRLNSFARAVQFQGITLPETLRLTVARCAEVVAEWQSAQGRELDVATARVLERTLPAIRGRLEFLTRVGADYLTLDRPTRTLSGGEFQRARLAACLGSGLVGACYVLDEPTVGLHPKDTAALIATLRELRDQGNTVLVVEHDPEVMRHADHLIELGPGAGADGGRLIASGSPNEVARNPQSVTGPFIGRPPKSDPLLSDKEDSTVNDKTRWLVLQHISVHNLRDLSVRIPLRALTAITGVSGSGKTSLVHHALVPHVRRILTRSASEQGKVDRGGGHSLHHCAGADADDLARLVEVTQAPLGRSPTSNAATYSGIWEEVCRLFAQLRESKLRGFRANRFRFNTAAGRCPECRGRGEQRIRLKLMPEVFVTCPACRGDRFNAATLQVRFRGLTVADVLRLRVEEARDLFANVPRIADVLRTFQEVGLGYLRLGQPAATLSGGEAQRVKLATELSRVGTTPTLFVLDEPTTGLHPLDVGKLLTLLRRLVSAGHTVVVIEHHLDVIARADWMIDLGPDGGIRGGQIIAEGIPRDVAARGIGYTAQSLVQR
jgi:excinuclease ABC subunit A